MRCNTRTACPTARALDLFAVGTLHFEQPDYEKFPCLRLAREAVTEGAAMQMVFNAANDAAVALFRRGAIGFWQIGEVIRAAMDSFRGTEVTSFEEIYARDAEIRSFAETVAQRFAVQP